MKKTLAHSIRVTPQNSQDKIIKLISNIDKTFILIHNKNKYFANPIVVRNYSRKINSILMSDPFFTQYTVLNYEGDFKIIEDFFQNGLIEFNENNAFFLLNIGCDLQIDYFVSNSIQFIPAKVFLANENNILERIYYSGSELNKVVFLLSSHFADLLNTDFILKMPIPFIDLILRSPSLRIKPQDLLIFLSKIFNFKKNPNHKLAKHIPLEILSKDEIREYLNDYRLNFNIQKLNLFTSFPINDRKINSSEFCLVAAKFSSNEFSPGVIKQIFNDSFLSNGKSHVLLSSSSVAYPTDMQESYGPEVLFNENQDEYFCTQEGKEQWLEIGFDEYEVLISGYGLKSWRKASNGVCPVSWSLQASNDHEKWIDIDQKEDILNLIKDNGIYLTEISQSKYYKFFRFLQLKTGNEGNTALALSGFEIYGTARKSMSYD